MRVLRLLLAVAVLFTLSSGADAGPIWFTYQVEAEYGSSGSGGGEFSIDHESSGSGWVDGALKPSADLASLWLDPAPPEHDPAWQPGVSNIVTQSTEFEVTLSLTDQASGDSDDVTLTGSAGSQWVHGWDDLYRADGTWISFDGSQKQELTLGDHVYTIEAGQAFDPHNVDVWASISISCASSGSPTPTPTPEPGTLVLGGLGLAAAGVARRRWRG